MRLRALFAKLWLLRRDVFALIVAIGDQRTPPMARVITVLSLLYLVIPVDIVPEFVPLLGIIDDLVLVPLGLSLAQRQLPSIVLEQARIRSRRYERLFTAIAVFFLFFVVVLFVLGLSLLLRFL